MLQYMAMSNQSIAVFLTSVTNLLNLNRTSIDILSISALHEGVRIEFTISYFSKSVVIPNATAIKGFFDAELLQNLNHFSSNSSGAVQQAYGKVSSIDTTIQRILPGTNYNSYTY